ncbi:MAG: hypothetical protein GXP33_13240, partial [Spirochaetes bacterium]|nr:hypothetical protein [Spirochaetota bacterium]
MRILYEKPSKQQREDSFFKMLLALEKDIPLGQWRKNESPDYILECTDITIGLEITSLVDSKLAPIRNAQHKVFAMAQSMAIARNIPIMEVQAKFRAEH